MVDERGLVALLHRADWRELSLSGEVRGGREPGISVITEQWQRGRSRRLRRLRHPPDTSRRQT